MTPFRPRPFKIVLADDGAARRGTQRPKKAGADSGDFGLSRANRRYGLGLSTEASTEDELTLERTLCPDAVYNPLLKQLAELVFDPPWPVPLSTMVPSKTLED